MLQKLKDYIKNYRLKNVFYEHFEQQSSVCITDPTFYDKFIKEIKKKYNSEEWNKYVEKHRLNLKKDQIINYNHTTIAIVEYFVLGITTITAFIGYFSNVFNNTIEKSHSANFIFIACLIIGISIIIVMYCRNSKNQGDSTRVAFYNLCLNILKEIEDEDKEKKEKKKEKKKRKRVDR